MRYMNLSVKCKNGNLPIVQFYLNNSKNQEAKIIFIDLFKFI